MGGYSQVSSVCRISGRATSRSNNGYVGGVMGLLLNRSSCLKVRYVEKLVLYNSISQNLEMLVYSIYQASTFSCVFN